MKLISSYSVKIKHYHHIFDDTVAVYREAVDFLIYVCLLESDDISKIEDNFGRQHYVEALIHSTKSRHSKYDFDEKFYKLPSYLRRSAISMALGLVSRYQTRKAKGESVSIPRAGHAYPAMFRDNTFVRTGTYTARIKVYIRNTWDWLDIDLKKGDVDYILHHCGHCHECAPVLRKRGREWFLDFAFEERIFLSDADVFEQTIVSVDLGLNHACTCCAMKSDGTILGRKILSLPREQDSLNHATNRIKKAQQHGARSTPWLWARAKGINDDIASKTANFIMDFAKSYKADVIVFEHLDIRGKKKGSKRQRLHHWKAQYVQNMVEHKAHRAGMHISRICAWGTSALAFDGSGKVTRNINGNYSICRFENGKIYNCDLSAAYNIGSRYFIREILKSLPETVRLDMEAKVPSCSKRTTCTLSTLLDLNAALAA